MSTCIVIKSNGEPCGGYAVRGSNFCFTHDPASAQARTEAHRKGGQRNRVKHSGPLDQIPVKPRSPDDVLQILDYTLLELLNLENSIQRGRLLVSIASVYLHVMQVGELEQRLANMELLFERYGITSSRKGGSI